MMNTPFTYGSILPAEYDCNASETLDDYDGLLWNDDDEELLAPSVLPSTTTLQRPINGNHHHQYHHRIPATASIPSEVANMTKTLIGGGSLCLSGGVALFASSSGPMAAVTVPVVAIVVPLGAVLGYFCVL